MLLYLIWPIFFLKISPFRFVKFPHTIQLVFSPKLIHHSHVLDIFDKDKSAESPTTRFYCYNVTTAGCPHDVFTKYWCQIDTMTIFLTQQVYFNYTFHHHEISFTRWSTYEFIKDYLQNGVSISISWLVMRFNIRILCNLHWILTIQNISTD